MEKTMLKTFKAILKIIPFNGLMKPLKSTPNILLMFILHY
ncbi:hypothetical protein MICAG_410006 [Microcystis aeruginosa PCC 9808]|uniref:Uncharacterized protein n=1 Tax=Microcystis aeruginosa PCC 9808 TaxID=1160284 RepID=I4I175_MICAE|nr:hypothetical protein MICAG_410006 [Microcystis aeruginosa PCC 9808]